MSERIRIKDIAEMAGVSVGTVDRILHQRPNVSPKAREKVEKVLKEINYQPNVYASALAYNRKYNFALILPEHDSEAYWNEIEEGSARASEVRRDFHVNVRIWYYDRFNEASFLHQAQKCLETHPNGIVLVPAQAEVTRAFTDMLHERSIPFILLDSYLPELNPLSFYGQDSFASGYFAAKVLMLEAREDREIMLMKQMKDGQIVSKQQHNREVGFRDFMAHHYPHVKIHEVNLPLDAPRESYDEILEHFYRDHPDVRHAITFNSKAHLVGDFLLRTGRRDSAIMGYDMVEKNADCLRKGAISFLIAQHAYMQGYACIDTLFVKIVLKKDVDPVNYMPIELLTKENIDYYRRTML